MSAQLKALTIQNGVSRRIVNGTILDVASGITSDNSDLAVQSDSFGTGAGNGYALNITSGSGGATSGASGAIAIQSGPVTDGAGGHVLVQAANSLSPSLADIDGGGIDLVGGNAANAGNGGAIAITSGNGGVSGLGGGIYLNSGPGGSASGDAGPIGITGADNTSGGVGAGGTITLQGGATNDASNASGGGSVFLYAGRGQGSNSGGTLQAYAGGSDHGVSGDAFFGGGSSSGPGADGQGGNATFKGGNGGTGGGAGGTATLIGGRSYGLTHNGGAVSVLGGDAQIAPLSTGLGGAVTIAGGTGSFAGNGGTVSIEGGSASGLALPGNVAVDSGLGGQRPGYVAIGSVQTGAVYLGNSNSNSVLVHGDTSLSGGTPVNAGRFTIFNAITEFAGLQTDGITPAYQLRVGASGGSAADGGALLVKSGDAATTGNGGRLSLVGGAGGPTSGDAGAVAVTGGATAATGQLAGNVYITGGQDTFGTDSARGGNVLIDGGKSDAVARSGDILIGTSTGTKETRSVVINSAVGGSGTSLQFNAAHVLDITAATATVANGATLTTTGTGTIDLPSNLTSRFQIENVPVTSPYITAPYFDALFDGSDVSVLGAGLPNGLHTHTAISGSATATVITLSSSESIPVGAPVHVQIGAGTVQRGQATAASNRFNCVGLSQSAAVGAIPVILTGLQPVAQAVFDVASGTITAGVDEGKTVYVSDTLGQLTTVAPNGLSTSVQKVGVIATVTAGHTANVIVGIGDLTLLPA